MAIRSSSFRFSMQEIGRRWGADRVDGREAAPDQSYEEEFRVVVANSIDKPRAPRNAISCRKDHVESSIGDYVPTLDQKGHPILRNGFMVECRTDLDCMSRCGTHPISGHHYACTHNVELYTHAGYSSEVYENLSATAETFKATGRPHLKIWLADPEDSSFYLIEEPGTLLEYSSLTTVRPLLRIPTTRRRRQVGHPARHGLVHRHTPRLHAHRLQLQGRLAGHAGDHRVHWKGFRKLKRALKPP